MTDARLEELRLAMDRLCPRAGNRLMRNCWS